ARPPPSPWGEPCQGDEWAYAPARITAEAKGNIWIAGGCIGPPTPAGRGRASTNPDDAGNVPGGAGAGRGGAGRGAATPPPPVDAQVLKFSRDGKFLLQIGHAGKVEGSNSTTGLNKPAGVASDTAANEVYVADGNGNRRVVVFDA